MTVLRFYTLLGVSQDATAEEIKKAYKWLAMEYHPDRNSDPDAANLFMEIKRAYEVLSDESARRQYDLSGVESVTSNSSQVFTRISGEFLKFIEDSIKAKVTNERAPRLDDIGITLVKERKHIEANIAVINKALACVDVMADDVESTSSVNVYAELLKDYTRKLNGDLQNANHHIEILNGAIDVLKEYKQKTPAQIEGSRSQAEDIMARYMSANTTRGFYTGGQY